MRILIVPSAMNLSRPLLFSSDQEASDTPDKATRFLNSALCKVPLEEKNYLWTLSLFMNHFQAVCSVYWPVYHCQCHIMTSLFKQ